MFSKYKQAAKQFCATKWHHTWTRSTQQRAWKMSINCHIFRFLQGSYPNSDVERLQTQCFKSVWVATALHQVGEKTHDGKWCNPTTGFDLPSQLWSSHCSTQHSPRRGRLAKQHMSSLVYSIRWFIGRLGLCSTGLAFSHCGELFARFNQFCMKTRKVNKCLARHCRTL